MKHPHTQQYNNQPIGLRKSIKLPIITRREGIFRRVIILLLIIIAARGVAGLFWQVFDFIHPCPLIISSSSARPLPLSPFHNNNRNISSHHLFGKSISGENSITITTNPTDLNLILSGIIAAHPMGKSLAIITTPENKDKQADEKRSNHDRKRIYAVGDTIKNQAVIRQILPDRVILERNGNLEALFLTPKANNDKGGNVQAIGDGLHWQMDGKFLDQQLANLASLSKKIAMRPYVKGGRQQGFILTAKGDKAFLQKLGLHANDIIYEINGIWIKDIPQAWKAFQKIRTTSQIKLAIGRNNHRIEQIYSINR